MKSIEGCNSQAESQKEKICVRDWKRRELTLHVQSYYISPGSMRTFHYIRQNTFDFS